MNKNIIIIFSFLLLTSNVSIAATGYQRSGGYQNGVASANSNTNQNQNNNSYYSHNGYNKSQQITNEREQGVSEQTQQELKQWLDEHPGQKEQLQQMFQSN